MALHNRLLLHLPSLALLAIILAGCTPQASRQPLAHEGMLDLRGWDPSQGGSIRLDGMWQFAWGEILDAAAMDTVPDRGFMPVPGTWLFKEWHGRRLPPFGQATYRLRLLPPREVRAFTLICLNQLTAYRLYVNDTLLMCNGAVSATAEAAVPEFAPRELDFAVTHDTIEIVVQVSNHHYWKGGMPNSLLLGLPSIVPEQHSREVVFTGVVCGVLMITAFIFLAFHAFRRHEKPSLYFGLMILAGAIRTVSTDNRLIMVLFPGTPWDLVIRMELGALFLYPAVIAMAFRSLFTLDFSPRALRIFTSISCVLLCALLLPPWMFSFLVMPAQLTLVALSVYAIVVSIHAIQRRRENAILFLIGCIGAIIPTFSEMLHANGIMAGYIPSYFGHVAFAIMQVIILARLFASAFRRVENFAGELEETVKLRTHELEQEKETSDRLLLNVLPEPIARRLKRGEATIADQYEAASVVFIDIVDFTLLSVRTSPQQVVQILNGIFTRFDQIAARHGLEKIKTIGDCYMAAAGIPVPLEDHAVIAARFAVEALGILHAFPLPDADGRPTEQRLDCRIGLDCGPIVAGVIGEQKFIYDLWGDMVNTASRMESHGIPGHIQITDRFRQALAATDSPGEFHLAERGLVQVKGKGEVRTWFLGGLRNSVSPT